MASSARRPLGQGCKGKKEQSGEEHDRLFHTYLRISTFVSDARRGREVAVNREGSGNRISLHTPRFSTPASETALSGDPGSLRTGHPELCPGEEQILRLRLLDAAFDQDDIIGVSCGGARLLRRGRRTRRRASSMSNPGPCRSS